MANKSLPPGLTKDEQELWNKAQNDLGCYCATFSAPDILKLLKKLSVERLRRGVE